MHDHYLAECGGCSPEGSSKESVDIALQSSAIELKSCIADSEENTRKYCRGRKSVKRSTWMFSEKQGRRENGEYWLQTDEDKDKSK